MQEEEESEYKERFPDYHAAFEDILEGDVMDVDEEPAQADKEDTPQQQVSAAEAGSASSKQLLQGQLLHDIVAQHARCVHTVQFTQCRKYHDLSKYDAPACAADGNRRLMFNGATVMLAEYSGIWLVSRNPVRTFLAPSWLHTP